VLEWMSWRTPSRCPASGRLNDVCRARSDLLVFGPAVAAHRHVTAGSLVEVRVQGWDIREPLQVACNGDRVLSRVQTGRRSSPRSWKRFRRRRECRSRLHGRQLGERRDRSRSASRARSLNVAFARGHGHAGTQGSAVGVSLPRRRGRVLGQQSRHELRSWAGMKTPSAR
jgi:hypothetical protein